MSFYFREKPRFSGSDKLRGQPTTRDELLQETKQQFDDDNKFFFEPAATRLNRDPFERHTAFSRGFPFDDVDSFGRRNSDIRSHLDDLAARHPEFADHLLGPAWGDIPAFHTGSLRNRRRGSGSSQPGQQQQSHNNQDEDARSQASGSSGTSAASGASGVSSQGDSNYNQRPQLPKYQRHQESSENSRRNPIPQYGLRNTVDIGQHRHDMENPEKMFNRGQRSMSAPPENRQPDDNIPQDNSQQSQNPRFVSRVDITPQFVPQQQQTGDKTATKTPQQSQKSQQSQGNVRHIPIFVEGRDEPVIPKNVDQVDHDVPNWSYPKSQPNVQQPPQFQSPPKFHRPSHFNQHYGRARDWLPHFEEEFYSPQTNLTDNTRKEFPFASSQHQTNSRQPQNDSKRQQEHSFYGQPGQQPHNENKRQQEHPQQHQQPQETPEEPKKQTQPKDPLEKVAEVQKEVDALNEQVKLWIGTTRTDKQYMYLDEMLTRELIKLDDIETEGKDNVRQARKNAIKCIQDSISLLESKAPIPGQQKIEPQPTVDIIPDIVDNKEENISQQSTNEQQAIPLPPAPTSPTKDSIISENLTNLRENTINEQQNSASRDIGNETIANLVLPVEKVPSVSSMEIQSLPDIQKTDFSQATLRNDDPADVELEKQSKSPKLAKKLKKTRKPQQQTPICDGAIPLPPPDAH